MVLFTDRNARCVLKIKRIRDLLYLKNTLSQSLTEIKKIAAFPPVS
jgi:hypothetical protein